jgi:hypothetical protein
MALYKDGNSLTHSNHTAFDAVLTPGTVVANSGIYRCVSCGDECACNKNNPLPPQNHHQHGQSQGAIRWKLLVCAQQK